MLLTAMNKPYAINFTANTATVTKQFLNAASTIDAKEFNTMTLLHQVDMSIVLKAPAEKKSRKLTY